MPKVTISAKSILNPDPTRLDREWVRQPRLLLEFADLLSGARKEYDKQKALNDIADAKLAARVRSNPSKYKLKSVNETAVKNAVLSHPAYAKRVIALIDLKEEVDHLSNMVTAIEHRKRALEGLVSLHGQKYFSVPRADEHGTKQLQENRTKRVVNHINKSHDQNKKRRKLK